MNISKLQIAIAEAERFLFRANECLKEDSKLRGKVDVEGFIPFPMYSPSVVGLSSATAAVKRASLDLSKALSDLRK